MDKANRGAEFFNSFSFIFKHLKTMHSMASKYMYLAFYLTILLYYTLKKKQTKWMIILSAIFSFCPLLISAHSSRKIRLGYIAVPIYDRNDIWQIESNVVRLVFNFFLYCARWSEICEMLINYFPEMWFRLGQMKRDNKGTINGQMKRDNKRTIKCATKARVKAGKRVGGTNSAEKN